MMSDNRAGFDLDCLGDHWNPSSRIGSEGSRMKRRLRLWVPAIVIGAVLLLPRHNVFGSCADPRAPFLIDGRCVSPVEAFGWCIERRGSSELDSEESTKLSGEFSAEAKRVAKIDASAAGEVKKALRRRYVHSTTEKAVLSIVDKCYSLSTGGTAPSVRRPAAPATIERPKERWLKSDSRSRPSMPPPRSLGARCFEDDNQDACKKASEELEAKNNCAIHPAMAIDGRRDMSPEGILCRQALALRNVGRSLENRQETCVANSGISPECETASRLVTEAKSALRNAGYQH